MKKKHTRCPICKKDGEQAPNNSIVYWHLCSAYRGKPAKRQWSVNSGRIVYNEN